MKNIKKISKIVASLIVVVIIFSSCEDFMNPDQGDIITENALYSDWYEYRSVEMGLYALQAKLVEQIVVLGELRGDLLEITDNADADMVEVYNFKISKNNRYASPTNFFKLISATNNLIRALKKYHPEVTDPNSPVNNFDKLYGEALCMRAWAYFNAVRIYGKVPIIYESLTTMGEVNDYLNSPSTYVDSVSITYGLDGYLNDTVYNKPINLEKQYYNQKLVIDNFTNELINNVKAVGVIHYVDNNDKTWEVTIWNNYAMNSLLGIMYLTDGDLVLAAHYFDNVIKNNSVEHRYQLAVEKYQEYLWKDIFNGIDIKEHILALKFSKSYYQQNNFQAIFDAREPNKYMLRPTEKSILLWETIWDDYVLKKYNTQPWKTYTKDQGTPGDFKRGIGVSLAYIRGGGTIVPDSIVEKALFFRSHGDFYSADVLMEGAVPVVWKYSIDKKIFDQDANFPIYRAAGIHLWLAEAYIYWAFEQNGVVKPSTSTVLGIVNDGSYYTTDYRRLQKGIRGRVGFGGDNDGIQIGNIVYIHDPYSNEVTGYHDFTGDFLKMQQYLEDQIIDERARELAFEGERFYDLMRVAKRRNDPSYLAEKVSQKYPLEKQAEIYSYLLDENNWYIHYFD